MTHEPTISTQCAGYADLWAAHRDNMRPVTPADVWGLREDRDFQPPSRAHIKRLQRVRPMVTRAEFYPHDANGDRVRCNQRARRAAAIADLCRDADRINR